MKYKFSELIDVGMVQTLVGLFYKATGVIGAALLDCDGTVIAASSWHELCGRFHRVNPETRQRCVESDTILADRIEAGQRHAVYTCGNGLIDCVAPVIVEGEHIANFFMGQFLFEPPDLAFFREQAQRFGFDEDAYMRALAAVPIVDEAKIQPFLDYFSEFARMLAEMAAGRLREMRAHETVRRSEALLRAVVEGTTDVVYVKDADGKYLLSIPRQDK